MFSPRRVLAVVRKESQELMRNVMSLILSIVAPVILFFLFSFGMSLDVRNIPMAILDEDRSAESRRLIDAFASSNMFQIKEMLTKYDDLEDIIRRGEIRLCVVIPPRFGRDIRRGMPTKLQALVDATYTNRAEMSAGYLEGTIAEFGGAVLNTCFLKYFGPSYGSGTGGMPISIYTSPWFNSTFRGEDFAVPGVIAIILIFLPPTIVAISLSKEKETGSILNMFCSPITKAEYIIGKSIPYIVITYFNFILFLLFTVFIFHVPMRGNLLLLLGVSLIYVITVIGLGIFVAVLVKSQIAAILITAVVNLIPSFMYSGFMIPVVCMDPSAKETAYSIAPTYYISFIRKLMLKGVGMEYLSREILALALMAFGYFLLSIVLFKKRLE
ncbi:MAG: ABC transporter permease [Candidatus Xenobiia bacterium LiM19]